MVHNPGYDFNDDNIAIGAAYWVLLAERFLAHPDQPATEYPAQTARSCAIANDFKLEAP